MGRNDAHFAKLPIYFEASRIISIGDGTYFFLRNNVLRYASQNSQLTQDRSTRVRECLRCQSSIMLDQRDKLRLTSGITYAEIWHNSPRKILLPRVETKITTHTNQFWQA